MPEEDLLHDENPTQANDPADKPPCAGDSGREGRVRISLVEGADESDDSFRVLVLRLHFGESGDATSYNQD